MINAYPGVSDDENTILQSFGFDADQDGHENQSGKWDTKKIHLWVALTKRVCKFELSEILMNI